MTTTRRWPGYLDIPEGKIGDWSITHNVYPAGYEFSTTTARTAIIGGQRGRRLRWDFPTRFHALYEGKALWMTDWPIEQAQCDVNLKPITGGRVLVGGLGLGLVATILARRKNVRHVTVVEKSIDCVKLVAENLSVPRGKLTIVVADLFEFLANERRGHDHFDWAFYDIWTSDSLDTLLHTVLPLREATMASEWVRHESRVICWNEDVMRGQVSMGLVTRLQFQDHFETLQQARLSGALAEIGKPTLEMAHREPSVEELATPVGNKWWDMYSPFWAWIRDESPSKSRALDGARVYAVVFGQRDWEARWKRIAKRL